MKLSRHLTDEHIRTIRRGGHDPEKVYAAYRAALEFRGAPSVVLAKTIKGYGMGEAGEGRMGAHQQKKLDSEALRNIRTRFAIPLSDEEVEQLSYYRPAAETPESQYPDRAPPGPSAVSFRAGCQPRPRERQVRATCSTSSSPAPGSAARRRQ